MNFQSIFQTNKTKIYLFILWVLLALIVVFYHEIWRDEMRALSIVKDSHSIEELILHLKNEGHPILWYILLKIGYSLMPYPVVLKILAFLIGATSVFLFLFYWRLPLWIKTAYIFSAIMMWDNTVMCRNYGIASLLIMAIGVFYDKKNWKAILILTLLLVQTNLIGAIVSISLWIVISHKFYHQIKTQLLTYITLSFFFILSLGFFYYITKPDQLSTPSAITQYSLQQILTIWNNAIQHPTQIIYFLSNEFRWAYLLLVALFTWIIRKDPWLKYSFLFSAVLFCFVDFFMYKLCSRHYGVILSFYFLILYIYSQQVKFWIWHERSLSDKISLTLAAVLLGVLCVINFYQCAEDINYEMSSSRAISDYIAAEPRYKNAVLVFEPDYLAEAIPYYIPNKIYLPREKSYRDYIHYTKENKNTLSIDEIIAFHNLNKGQNNSPTLLISPLYDSSKNQVNYNVYVDKTLLWAKENKKNIVKIKEFNNGVKEFYTLYEIK